jgi:hypothetical protein
VNDRAGAPQLVACEIDFEIGEPEIQGAPRCLSRTRVAAARPFCQIVADYRTVARYRLRKPLGNLQRESKEIQGRLQL